MLAVVGYIAGMLHANMFAEGWLLPVTVVAVASRADGVRYGIMLAVLGDRRAVLAWFFTNMLPERCLRHGLGLLIYPGWRASCARPADDDVPPPGVSGAGADRAHLVGRLRGP